MKYLLAFMLFLCGTSEASAIYSVHRHGNFVVNSAVSSSANLVISPTKKLSYKKRVMLNYVKLKAKLKAKLSDEALTFVITGAIFLLLGVVILAKGSNNNNNNSTPQGGVGNESSAIATVLGVVLVAAGIICFLVALIDSI
jgi:hypothetical protein